MFNNDTEEVLFKEATEKCETLGLNLRFSKMYEIYVVEKLVPKIVTFDVAGFKTLEEVIEYCNDETKKDTKND